MKQKRYIQYFIILSIIIIAILLSYNFYQYAKKYDYKKLFNTDRIESYRNYIVYKLFNKSMEQEKVIVGKDGFLFLGNGYGKVLYKMNGMYRPSKSKLDKWTNQLKDLQKWYENQGIKFLIVLAPNKHSIYKEKLPNWMQYDEKTITDDIMEFSIHKKINILDLRKIFVEYKKEHDLLIYQKTDTHWNNIASSLAYKETIKKLNILYDQKLKSLHYSIADKKYKSGDLSQFLKIDKLLKSDHENIYHYEFQKSMIKVSEFNLTNYSLKQTKKVKNKNLFTNYKNYFITNKQALNSENLLFVSDSFSSNGPENVGNSMLYSETFNSIVKFHFLKQKKFQITPSLLEKFNINMVIYQIVERDIYNKLYFNNANIIKFKKINQVNKEIFNLSNDKYSKNNQFDTIVDHDAINLKVTKKDPIIILNQTKSNSKNVVLSYSIQSPHKTKFQIFYKEKKDSSYSERDSYSVVLKKGMNQFNLLIPSKYINNDLRVDLVSHIGEYKINEFKIYETNVTGISK